MSLSTRAARHLSSLVLAVFFFAPDAALAQSAEPVYSAAVRLGMEYDDNTYREDQASAQPDFLTRYFTAFDAYHPVEQRGMVTLNLRHGGKLFVTERDADTLLTQLDLGYRHRLGQRFGLSLDLDLKDRTERLSTRDYNRGGARLGTTLTAGRIRVGASAGWRYFAYKPNPRAGSHGPQGHGYLRWSFTPALSLDASYTVASRAYDTPRLTREADIVILDESGPTRRDHFQALRLGTSLRQRLFADLHYVYSQNRSNSYGNALTRHGVELNLTAPLFWELLVSVKAELQRTRYEDPVLIDEIFIIDDENRNALVLAIARHVVEDWEIEARYSIYRQEFGVGERYGRQTIWVGVGYEF